MVYERNELKVDWKPRLALSASKIGRRTKYQYLALTLIFAGIAALIPHLIDGHVFFLARAYAESVGILLNMGMALVFYALFRRDVKTVLSEKHRSEKKLLSSYEYIGKANRLIQMLQKYSSLSVGDLDDAEIKNRISAMIEELTVEVFAADSALFRFINIDNCRTLSEFEYSKSDMSRPIKLSNRLILGKRTETIEGGDGLIIISREYDSFGIVCAAGFSRVRSTLDRKTFTVLVNQVFLLFVFYKSVGLSASLLKRLQLDGS